LMTFVDYPLPGRVEHVLTSEVGAPSATVLHTCLVLDTLTQLDMVRMPTHVFYAPRGRRRSLEVWLGTGYGYALQRGTSFEQRLGHAFASLFDKGYERVVWVSSNVPDLPFAYLTVGVHELTRADAVIGPGQRDTCYLFGLAKDSFRSSLFEKTRSCSQLAMALEDEGSCLKGLPQWDIVESVRDLHALRSRAGATVRRYSLTLSYLRNREHILGAPTSHEADEISL
ncbi:MAG TPA: DUF2064 domain-containing protein, partial [Methanomicrobia archaeon]|nr:DUF2064 domain-containing protein [Methanomicrobia archaeon]